ncbi:MAG TPA: zinc ribbon domain-containing protein [Candidatus Anoxymicrobiaceae bacterium]
MAWANEGGVFSFQCGWEVLFDSTWEAIPLCKGWVQYWKPREANKPYGSIAASVPWSVVGSYGEKIAIQITETPPGTSWLTVSSTSNWGVVDFGKNNRNINKLINAVNAVLASKGVNAAASARQAMLAAGASPQQAAAPATPVPQPRQEAAASFCPQCGADLKADAKFCAKCGATIKTD